MLCRLYNKRRKSYVPVDETTDYMVHPVGAVFNEGAEDFNIEYELSTQRLDDNGKEIFVNDIIEAEIRQTHEKVRGVIVYSIRHGMFLLNEFGKLAVNSSGRTRNWNSYTKVTVIGTTHDDEMEAE